MLDIREVVIDENNVILGGHQRVKAALANGDETIPVKQVFGLTEEQKRQFVIKDNIANGDWDWDELANHWDDLDLDGWGLETDWTPKSEKEYDNDDPDTGGLVRKFGAPPLSVLETRQGYWQDRKKFWLDLGIESEQGRDGGLLGGFADMAERAGTKSNGTSVFDPFLCELIYDWFNVDGGTVIDPFAGGSVRGIVAARTGHPYTGLVRHYPSLRPPVRGFAPFLLLARQNQSKLCLCTRSFIESNRIGIYLFLISSTKHCSPNGLRITLMI